MIKYNKLIRDNIPKIIDDDGKNYSIKHLNDDQYIIYLNEKLQEELDEYYQNNNIEELADIIEVIYAILNYHGVSKEKFEELRLKKRKKRGGFENKICLLSVEE